MAIDEKVENQNGVMQRLRNSLSSKKGNLVAGLGALALAGSIYATQPSQAYAEEPDHCDIVECVEGGVKLPDLSDAEYVGKQKVDNLSSVNGKETIQKGYLLKDKKVIVSYFEFNKEQPYGFAIRSQSGDIRTYADKKADWLFEQEGGPGASIDIDISSYKK